MVEQAHEASSAISPEAGPNEVESNTLSINNMSGRAAQLIGRQLAQIGDELNSRWSEKPHNLGPQRHRWQAYVNLLNLGDMNCRIIGRFWWSKGMSMVKTSWVVSQLHGQPCQTAMKWIRWVYNSNFSDWSSKTKGFLASAVLLVVAAAFTATWKISES